MRLWSIHPSYLDSKGLVACWRESLLAKNVLEGKTVGYKNHPQLKRFKEYSSPVKAINAYIYELLLEAKKRKYKFDEKKVKATKLVEAISVNDEQLNYEYEHLLEKVKKRSSEKYEEIKNTKQIKTHPLFKEVKGPIEAWEKT